MHYALLPRTGTDYKPRDRMTISVTEPFVERERRTDQTEMREGLGEVPQQLAAETHLLGVGAEVVGLCEHLLGCELRRLETTRARQALHVPETAHRKGAFGAA
jgi:hypothetical protein